MDGVLDIVDSVSKPEYILAALQSYSFLLFIYYSLQS